MPARLNHNICLPFQIFAIGSSLYAFCMALETNILLGLITGKNPERAQLSMENKETYYRHIAYHIAVNTYGVAVTIWINAAGVYGNSWTPWCYFDEPKYRIFCAYIPIWIAIGGIVLLDASVVRKTMISYKLIASSRSDSFVCSESRPGEVRSMDAVSVNSATSSVFRATSSDTQMNSRMIRLIVRMLLYPIALMLLLVPGFILRICDWSGSCNFTDKLYWSLAKIQRACDPSAGIVVAVIWVISDLNVRNEWRKILKPYMRPLRCWANKSNPRTRKGSAVARDGRQDTRQDVASSTTELSRIEHGSGQSSSVLSRNTMYYVTDDSNEDSIFASTMDGSISGEESDIEVSVLPPWRTTSTDNFPR